MLTLDLVAPFSSVVLRRHVGSGISHIEMPAAIELRETLPKTTIGKLSRKELNAEEEARRERK